MSEEKKEIQNDEFKLDLENLDFEDDEQDDDYYDYNPKKNNNKMLIIITSIIFVLIAIWLIFFRSSTLIPNMQGWSRYEVDNWATKNDVGIIYSYEYNDIEENYVIRQSVPNGTKIKNGLEITVTLSDGLDPNELIEMIDLTNSTDSDIQSWIDANKLYNVELKYTYNPTVPENHVVSYEFNTGNETSFKRGDELVIEISRGTTSNVEKVSLPDFTEVTLGESLAWGENNGITIKINYVFSEYTNVDKIIKQDINPGTKVTSSNIVNLTVSKGKQIIVPDFSKLTKSRAIAWAEDNGASITINETYSSQVLNGYLINQSVPVNEIVSSKDDILVTYSLGKIDIFSYVNQPVLTMKNAMDELNLNGANITYDIEYVFTPNFEEGMIVSHSYEYSEMNPGAIMNIMVSKGESVFVPDFDGMTQEEIINICQTNEIICVFKYKNYPSPKGWLISQSIDEGTVISKNDPVIITMSLGSK